MQIFWKRWGEHGRKSSVFIKGGHFSSKTLSKKGPLNQVLVTNNAVSIQKLINGALQEVDPAKFLTNRKKEMRYDLQVEVSAEQKTTAEMNFVQ